RARRVLPRHPQPDRHQGGTDDHAGTGARAAGDPRPRRRARAHHAHPPLRRRQGGALPAAAGGSGAPHRQAGALVLRPHARQHARHARRPEDAALRRHPRRARAVLRRARRDGQLPRRRPLRAHRRRRHRVRGWRARAARGRPPPRLPQLRRPAPELRAGARDGDADRPPHGAPARRPRAGGVGRGVEPEASAGDPVGEPELEAVLPPAPPPPERRGRGGAHAVRVAAGILLSRLAGFAREAISGYFFGVSAWADVYSTAMRMPNLLQNLLGDQALSASFIPFYSKMLAEKRDEDARRFAGAILGLLLMAAGALALLGVVFARPIVAVTAPGFVHDAEKVAAHTLAVDRYALTVQQVRVLFPMAGLLVLSAWALAVLNSHRRFFLPYVAPVVWNLSIIATFVLVGRRLGGAYLGPLAKNELLYAAAWGALVGGALQLAIQLPTVLRLLGGLELSFGTRARGVREALRAFGPVVAGRGALQLSGYLDYVLASLAAAGAASAFRYAYALFLLPVGLFATSVAVTELPEVSRLQTDEA